MLEIIHVGVSVYKLKRVLFLIGDPVVFHCGKILQDTIGSKVLIPFIPCKHFVFRLPLREVNKLDWFVPDLIIIIYAKTFHSNRYNVSSLIAAGIYGLHFIIAGFPRRIIPIQTGIGTLPSIYIVCIVCIDHNPHFRGRCSRISHPARDVYRQISIGVSDNIGHAIFQ